MKICWSAIWIRYIEVTELKSEQDMICTILNKFCPCQDPTYFRLYEQCILVRCLNPAS